MLMLWIESRIGTCGLIREDEGLRVSSDVEWVRVAFVSVIRY